MFKSGKPNPFQVLGLPTGATTKAITARGDEQCVIAEPDDQLLYRWAVEELITHPLTRLLHELYEAPDTDYEDQDWENFLRKYKRSPIRRTNLPEPSKETRSVNETGSVQGTWSVQETGSVQGTGSAQGTIPTMEGVSPPGLADFNFSALMELLLDGLLTVPEVEITPAMLDSPWQSDPDPDKSPLEVQDVIFG